MRPIRYAIRKVWEKLPPKLSAAIEFHSKQKKFFYPWGAAMNGQTARLEICRRCLTHLPIEVILETGTYRGVTTEWFANFGMPVHSIEIEPRFHYFSCRRLRDKPNVTLTLGDSKTAIMGNLSEALSEKSVFAYLDAHWREHLPLKEELTEIDELAEDYVVLIDDFQVPGDSGYEYDDYGATGSCTLEFIAPAIDENIAIYYPSTPSNYETGYKRGYVVLAKGAANEQFLDELDLLQRFPR